MTSSNSQPPDSTLQHADGARGTSEGGLPVRIVFFEQSIGCETCAPTRRVLEQIARENPGITLDTLNLVLDKEKAAEYGVDRVPAIIVSAPGRDRIRFYGAPLGNELPTLLEAIRMTATGETRLSEQSRAQLKALARPVRLQVFFTPTCVYCPAAISLANQAAVESPLVSTVAIDATEFPDLVRRYNVNGVPKTVIDDETEIVGAAPEDEFITAIT
jgi:glutaredoxin-like protein